MEDRRNTGYPEFMNVYERDFKKRGTWEDGRLAALSRDDWRQPSGARRTVAKCEALRAFLVDLPELVGAADAATFVTGDPVADISLLPEAAATDLRRWHAWIAELYALGVSVIASASTRDAAEERILDIVYAELDPFLTTRLRYWGALYQECQAAGPGGR